MSNIIVIQNVANGEILTWNGSSVTTHGLENINSANNFHARVLEENDQYHIEGFNNESVKLQPATGGPDNCHQAIPVSSTATVWEAEYRSGGNSLSGIKLFTTNSSGNKWYLRVPFSNFNGEQPDLVCPDHENHVEDYNEDELLFNLIFVDVNNIS